MSLQQLTLILFARWRVICKILLGTIFLITAVSFILPKKYTATASVLVDARASDPIYGGMVQSQVLPGYIATQVDIASSERVARRVVRDLGLDKNPQAIAQWKEEGNGSGTVEQFFAEALSRKLEVTPSRESSVISISFTGSTAEFSSIVANAFAKAYIDTNLELKVQPAKEFAGWFGDRTKQLRDSLEKAQTRLSEYQQKEGIVATDERFDIESARLAELSSQLSQVESLKSDSASRSRQAKGSMASSPDVIQSPVVQGLRADIARSEAKLKELSGQLGINHPQYQRAAAELETLKARLDVEMRQVANSVGTTNAVVQQREDELKQALDAQKKKVLQLKEVRDRVAVLQRDVEAAQRAYELVTQRLSQTNLESQSQQTNVVLLSPAVEPMLPSGPKILRNFILSILLGAFFGITWAMILELFDPRFRGTNDLASIGNIPMIGVLPKIKVTKKAPRAKFGLFRKTRTA